MSDDNEVDKFLDHATGGPLQRAVKTFLDGYWPKEVVEDWRYKRLFAASEAARDGEAAA